MPIAAGQDATAQDVLDLAAPIGGIVAWLKTFAQRATGTNTSTSASKLIDSAANFTTSGVAVDDIVENNTDGTFAYVTAIDSATQLSLSANIFTATSKTYYVWKTPKLSTWWAECNGQTLSDAGSRYNGVALPNLNASGGGSQRFLRGSTRSGATGGEDTHVLTSSEMPAHTHNIIGKTGASGSEQKVSTSGQTTQETAVTESTGGGAARENRPPYYEIVWVMRIK